MTNCLSLLLAKKKGIWQVMGLAAHIFGRQAGQTGPPKKCARAWREPQAGLLPRGRHGFGYAWHAQNPSCPSSDGKTGALKKSCHSKALEENAKRQLLATAGVASWLRLHWAA